MELRCSAFLFDLDGVLVDSRSVVERVCHRWALRHKLNPAQVLRIAHGRRTRDTVRALTPHLDLDNEVAWLDAAELADTAGLREVPGARGFVAALPRERWAVVTSCGQALARLRLTSVAMPIPDVIVASEGVSRGKPAPDGYQLAATRLGRDIARCLVFEDAPPGIVAAEVAGARVIALRTTHPEADFTGAEVIIPDFTRVRLRHDHDAFIVTIQ